jgi:hypothetical protein
MPVKVGCASDYNKNHPERIQKKRDEETAQASSVFDTSNQLAMTVLNAARENMEGIWKGFRCDD